MSELYPTSQNSNLPPGPQGPAGASIVGPAGADGISAYAVLLAAFSQPASSGDVTVSISESRWLALGQTIFIENGGYYSVVAVPSNTTAVVRNLGLGVNAAALAVVSAGSKVATAGVNDAGYQTQLDDLDSRLDTTESAITALQAAVIAGVTIANVGGGEGLIYAGVTGSTQKLRTLKANGGIAITVDGDEILLTATAGSFSVEHSGVGQTLIKSVVSGVTTLKGLTAGDGIGLTVTSDSIEIENTQPAVTVTASGLLTVAHVGDNYEVALDIDDLPVASIVGSGLVTVTPAGNDFTIALPVSALPVQSVVAGAGVATVSNVAGAVTVAVPATTISHVAGSGTELLSSASGTNVVGKKLVAGTNVTLSESSGLITIAAAGGGGSGDVSYSETPRTFYVSNSGNDTTGDGTVGTPYLTITRCFSEIQKYNWKQDTPITIQLPTGAYAAGTTHQLGRTNGASVTIKGATPPATTTLVSVQASSGSSRNYTLNLNLSSATNIVVGDFLILRDTTGGTNPDYCRGLFKVTAINVDGVATRVSVLSHAAGVPSGACVNPLVKIVKSSVVAQAGVGNAFNASWTSAITLQDFIIDGNGTVGTCLAMFQAMLLCSGYFGTWGAQNGVYCGNGSRLNIGSGGAFSISQTSGTPLLATHSSTIVVATAVVTGGNKGISSQKSSFIDCYQSFVHSAVIGLEAFGGQLLEDNGIVSFCTTGMSADIGGYISALGVSFGNNTTNASPAVNTLGNRSSYIATT